ncbi:pyrimidine/purine nucleoside phosphorylase [Moraxella atlantae]|uniref:pyrimidine/purine nucleoside phosphorylase n=1 Tax=Faucicola atlantae TaxID=34059 RepID=UPI003753E2F5
MPNSIRFDHVSVEKIANVYYEGRSFSRTVWFEDGRKKMLGIILPCDSEVTEYEFHTESSERIEILAGECEVKRADEDNYTYYRAGQAFVVEGHSSYTIKNEEIVQYICHFEG